MDRRDFIKLMSIASGASLIHSCGMDEQTDKLIPYLVPPEKEVIPGQAVYYNTVCRECPAGCGVSAKVREGNPVKLEGLAGHPINDGALCVRGQASLMRRYHPDRLAQPMMKGSGGEYYPLPWEQAFEVIITAFEKARDRRHRYLSGRTSGSLSVLIDEFCAAFGIERAPEWEMISYANLREANSILFGARALPFYSIDDADLLVTVGADIIETFANPVAHAVQLGRKKADDRFHWTHIEPHVSLTGLRADERATLTPGTEFALLGFLVRAVHDAKRAVNPLPADVLSRLPRMTLEETAKYTGIPADTVGDLEERMTGARRPLVIAGGVSAAHKRGLDAAVLAGLLQWATGAIPVRVDFDRAADYSRVGTLHDMKKFAADLEAARTGVLFVSRIDPVREIGAALSLPAAFAKASFRVALTDMMTDTARACDLVLPLSHTLESWGDDTAWKGVTTVMQPAVEPLDESLPEGDILIRLMSRNNIPTGGKSYQEYLFKKWNRERGERFSEDLVTAGFYRDSPERMAARLDAANAAAFLGGMAAVSESRGGVLVTPWTIRTFDGRSAALPLLNEIPDPLTTITYGRWIAVSEAAAGEMHLGDNDEVRVTGEGFEDTLYLKVQPFLPAGVFMITADQIESRPLRIDKRSGELLAYIDGVQIVKTGHSKVLPILSGSPSQAGRGLIPDAKHLEKDKHRAYSFYPEPEFPVYHWTMVIDLDRCIGCSACVAACYIENNVPLSGGKEHLKGRELSWLRIEPYYEKDGRAHFLPMMCQQCDNAPCEPVCPVYATYHNPEGLNAQIYNRCVGTRYCANNCPYKVRRFNWFDPKREGALVKMLNPDISARGRGIMEKCTFCVQRIRAARDRAKDEKRTVQDGDVVPACAQTCPAGAIQFGNLLDKTSAVYQLIHSKRVFRVHEHLGTEPSIYYVNKKGMKHDV